MKKILNIAAMVILTVSSLAAAQSVTFDFEDSTDQGFGTGFGNDASANFVVTDIGGSKRMLVPSTPSFQEASRESGNPADPFYQAMLAASANEGNFLIKYDYYIDTANFSGATYLQLGTFVNTGSGYYAQNFPATKEVELNGAQLASGSVFTGTVQYTFAAAAYDLPLGETFFRFGLILNGDGENVGVHYDNIYIGTVPEPTSFGLIGVALAGLSLRRRSRAH